MSYYSSNSDFGQQKPAYYNGYRNFSSQVQPPTAATSQIVGCHRCAIERQHANYVGAPNDVLAAAAEEGGIGNSVDGKRNAKSASVALLICLTIVVSAFIAAIVAAAIVIPVVLMNNNWTTTPGPTTAAETAAAAETATTMMQWMSTAAAAADTSAATMALPVL